MVPKPLPDLFNDPNLVKREYVNTATDLTFTYKSYFVYNPILGCDLNCGYTQTQVAIPATTEPKSVTINSASGPGPGPGPAYNVNEWPITAPTNVIKGYKEEFVFTCSCNNLYTIPDNKYEKIFTIEQLKLDCSKFLEKRTEPDPLEPELVTDLENRSLKY